MYPVRGDFRTVPRSYLLRTLVAACSILSYSSVANALELYSNGAPNGNTESELISVTNQVTNSFVLSQDSILQQVANIGIWVKTGDTPQTVSWSIGTSEFGTDLFSGTDVQLTNTYVKQITIDPGHDLYSSSISLGSLQLATGTYWLTLTNGVSEQAVMSWDWSGGPSAAFTRIGSSGIGSPVGQSQAFTIIGVPEPSTFVMCGIAAALIIVTCRTQRSMEGRDSKLPDVSQ
jgi:hypothetical protein